MPFGYEELHVNWYFPFGLWILTFHEEQGQSARVVVSKGSRQQGQSSLPFPSLPPPHPARVPFGCRSIFA